jgi:fructose-bisphosphate aldolase class II
MKTLREYILDYESQQKAIGHFNITTLDMLWAVFNAAQKVSEEVGEKIPVVIGTSEGEREFFGQRQFVDFIRSLREQYDYPVFSNADHTMTVQGAQDAIDAGYDMVIIDAADKPIQENITMTRNVVLYRNNKNADTLIEAELGYIGSGSSVKDVLPEGVTEATMTKPEEADMFVRESGVDLLAPSVGNVHGMIRSGNPRLDPERTTLVRKQGGVPMVLHGGSGSADEDFVAVIKAGISMIHISTELRTAYRAALEKALADNTSTTPYTYLKGVREAVQEVVEKRIRLFYTTMIR